MKNTLQSPHSFTIVTGAVIAICVLIFQSYLSQSPNKLDDLQRYSLVALSIAIPGLSFWYYVSYYVTKTGKHIKLSGKNSDLHMVVFIGMYLASYISALIAIGLTIWRFYTLAGIIFIVVSFISVVYFVLIEVSENKL